MLARCLDLSQWKYFHAQQSLDREPISSLAKKVRGVIGFGPEDVARAAGNGGCADKRGQARRAKRLFGVHGFGGDFEGGRNRGLGGELG